jgi:hypothetical protein
MSCSTPAPKDSPLILAWEAFKLTEAYANALRWLAEGNYDGELWCAFERGFAAALLAGGEAAEPHECVDFAPAGYTGHWREWHRGHGCKLDPTVHGEAAPEPPKQKPFKQHAKTCPAYGNYQPPYEECDCGADDE